MADQITQLLENYKDGVPVKIERQTLITLALVELLVITMGAVIVKIVKNL